MKLALSKEIKKEGWGSTVTDWIEYYYVSLNWFSATSHSHRGHGSSLTETSLPSLQTYKYIMHGHYLALINSHMKLQLCEIVTPALLLNLFA